MKLDGRRILLTGASSGIGREVARTLGGRGARVALVGRDRARLEVVRGEVRERGGEAAVVVADLAESGVADRVAGLAGRELGGPLDAAVFVAGVNRFVPFDRERDEEVERMFRVNVLAPLSLTRALLPGWRDRAAGRAVFVGSVFGALGFPCFAAYSATKAALRGFTEALRRELAGTGVTVTLVQPRATKTPMTDDQGRLAEATKMKLDPPGKVAERLVRALERGEREVVIGVPERIFVKLNAVVPGLIDRALGKEAARIRPLAEERLAAEGVPEDGERSWRQDQRTNPNEEGLDVRVDVHPG
ncbi:MAG: SDR family oxidoreductase [Planctomycetota bacterium JB042]